VEIFNEIIKMPPSSEHARSTTSYFNTQKMGLKWAKNEGKSTKTIR
jgi:hypothetical protein